MEELSVFLVYLSRRSLNLLLSLWRWLLKLGGVERKLKLGLELLNCFFKDMLRSRVNGSNNIQVLWP